MNILEAKHWANTMVAKYHNPKPNKEFMGLSWKSNCMQTLSSYWYVNKHLKTPLKKGNLISQTVVNNIITNQYEIMFLYMCIQDKEMTHSILNLKASICFSVILYFSWTLLITYYSRFYWLMLQFYIICSNM